jgi:hypothetical protein
MDLESARSGKNGIVTPPQMYTTDAPMANEEFTGFWKFYLF